MCNMMMKNGLPEWNTSSYDASRQLPHCFKAGTLDLSSSNVLRVLSTTEA